MLRTPILLIYAFLLASGAFADIKLPRHPTYSNGRVAFSYLGDIWIVKDDGTNILRLTDNKARDIYPRFSPDGQWLAFSSNRDGNYDVFVVAAAGGKPKQLTFHSADDNVVGWSPDGKKVLFSSVRAKGAFPTVATLFEISVDGGVEQPLPMDWGASASYSPDGTKLAFMRHPSVWSRKHYRGAFAADLWVMDVPGKTYKRLGDEDYKGNYLWPMYGNNGEIFFVSDRTSEEKGIKHAGPEVMKSVNNIWKISEKGGAPVQVTHHTDGNLFFPAISGDRRTIVYEDNFTLHKLDVASGKTTEIRVDIKSDSKENDSEVVTLANDAESFHLSPSTRRAAVIVHGELFTIATERGEPQRVTDTPWREQDPRWSPDGKWIAFVSDRTGRQEVWISNELAKSSKKLSDVDCDKTGLEWAPDSKALLWSGSDHKLRRVEVESGKTDILASNEAGVINSAQFSPDGKWISYAKQDRLLRSHVWIKNLQSGDEHMLNGEDFQVASSAKWTPDGKKLLLIGGVSVPSMASQGFRGTPSQLFAISLVHAEKAPEDHAINTEEQAMAAPNENAPTRGGRGANAAPVNVNIEWDGMDRRIKKLTNMPSSVTSVVPSPDSKTYVFMAMGGQAAAAPGTGDVAGGGPGYYIIRDDGTAMERLNTAVANTTGPRRGAPVPAPGGRGAGQNEPQWSRDGRSIYLLLNSSIYSVTVPPMPESGLASASASTGGAGRGRATAPGTSATATTANAGPRRVDFSVQMIIDRPAERQQVFEEAWRVMKNRFYDGNMHGVNWAAAKDKYESVLEHIADTEELHNVIMEMIGDMNASHTGISGGGGLPGEAAQTERPQVRYPGFTLATDVSGRYKVESIYTHGPADYEYMKIAAGNFVLAVNGQEIKTTDNYWHRLTVLPGRKMEFLINSKPEPEGAWTITVEPLSAAEQTNLEYRLWVEKRKEMVDKLTEGQIGYLHIRAMDAPGLLKFQEDLIDNRGKKALIIDERFNGGGGIDQELLEILNQRKQYQFTRGRDSLDVPRPVQAFYGPMVVLQNERSASDAEMFPDGFRRLGLGKLVGMPTMGAVIGTGAFGLLNGSQIRTPGSGVYTATGENMENYGVTPDVWIDNTPIDFAAGHDRQIEKAIEVLRSETK
jgi:tricorn protease